MRESSEHKTNMKVALEHAAAVYREIKSRGLDLRRNHGRDHAMLAALASSLGCHDLQLQAYLDRHPEISAETFLREFLRIAAPFAKMFEEIWQYLASNLAPRADETIAVRFGVDASHCKSVDLECFRRYVETTRKTIADVRIHAWPNEALKKLFELGRKLGTPEVRRLGGVRLSSRKNIYYSAGKPYPLPELTSGTPELVRQIHQLLQNIIESYAEARQSGNRRSLPELESSDMLNNEQFARLANAASLLSDLLPSWEPIFSGADALSIQIRRDAEEFFSREIEPLLTQAVERTVVPLLAALDILDLPFWRDRWHTYEIWASIATLRSLHQYRPCLRVVAGRVPLDGYTGAIIADLTDASKQLGCAAVQASTTLHGRQIKPDLRICTSKRVEAATTVAIVEFKQRKAMTCAHAEKVAAKYAAGAPHAGGVLLLNYDQPQITPNLPPNSLLMQGIQPLAPSRIAAFEMELLQALSRAGFDPEKRTCIVLLDVSGSMGESYTSDEAQSALRRLVDMPFVRIYRFNDGLVAGGDLNSVAAGQLSGRGGTQLGRALAELEQIFGQLDKLLLVSDGRHEDPPRLEQIPEFRECSPDELGDSLEWLLRQ